MRAQLKALGGGQAAIERLAAVEAGNVSGALEGTEIQVTRWLSVRGVAALARTAFDPAAVSMIESRTGADAGVDPSAMGPMFMEEPRGASGLVWTDSGVHTTLWIHEWPRAAAPIGFVSDLVFARHPVTGQAISHIFTVVLTPAPQREAFKRPAPRPAYSVLGHSALPAIGVDPIGDWRERWHAAAPSILGV